MGGYRWKRPGEILLFDLFLGNTVFTTTLLDSHLKQERHRKIREMNKIYVGVLNSVDLIITKLFRGTSVDMEDCKLLIENKKVDLEELKACYKKTAQYETSEEKVLRNLELFLKRIA